MEPDEILKSQLHLLKRFHQKNSIREFDLPLLKTYLDNLSTLSCLTHKEKIRSFERISVNSRLFDGQEERINKISLLKNPPENCVKKYGRANLKKQSVLYGTFDFLTAINEMRPQKGNLVTKSKWILKTNYDLKIATIFNPKINNKKYQNLRTSKAQINHIEAQKSLDDNSKKQIYIILKFLSEIFAKEVDDENHYDYYLGSYFANKILYEFDNSTIDAIIYPSVREDTLLSNIVIKPIVFKNNYRLESVEEKEVIQVKKENCEVYPIMKSNKFRDDTIIWE
jgi:hypothetical protein